MSQFSNLLNLLMATSPEAEAAGISTLMKKLGVSLQEAKAIKAAAIAKKGTSLQDENIRALQNISDYKRGNLEELGQGADAKVYDAGDKVVKVPKGNRQADVDAIKKQAIDTASPVMLGDLGVPTKNVKTSQNMYQVQDKLNTPKVRPGTDTEFRALDNVQSNVYDKTLDFMRQERIPITGTDDIKKHMTPEDAAWYDELEGLKDKRINNMWKEQGVDPDDLVNRFMSLPPEELSKAQDSHYLFGDDIKEFPMDTLAALTDMEARRAVKGVYPQDVHSGNIGLDADNNARIFDTSRFKLKDPNEIKPEQFEQIKNSLIGSRQNKEEILNILKPKGAEKVPGRPVPLGLREKNALPENYAVNKGDDGYYYVEERYKPGQGAIGAGKSKSEALGEAMDWLQNRKVDADVLDKELLSGKLKKAAAVAPMAGAVPQDEDTDLFTSAKESVLSGIASGINSPTAQGLMDIVSIPGALGRTTINAVTENRAPSMEELGKAATFPTSPENEALATQATERIIPDADNVKSRTALDTILKFM